MYFTHLDMNIFLLQLDMNIILPGFEYFSLDMNVFFTYMGPVYYCDPLILIDFLRFVNIFEKILCFCIKRHLTDSLLPCSSGTKVKVSERSH